MTGTERHFGAINPKCFLSAVPERGGCGPFWTVTSISSGHTSQFQRHEVIIVSGTVGVGGDHDFT